ncbi:NUDIX domain-containing protein [Hafnia alvei]|uniref:ADP-ribose pyrophosphatase YjhB, NUDIX family n=1 Tax=Hafnia alvei TaxID=569 RepID=A0A1C6Z2E2_HAFAL|nr:NUDIX domain-containing protein [Hafnia alvei]NLS52108.1 NUDIX domain-containing protein [Hafnia alvei]SCM53164.1 ADP-ribose pyrophosphatase YjhB, NUDIX family [Hafnia alvei]
MPKFRPYLAVYIIVRQQQSILLLQRKNTGFDDGKWSLPAGHVEEGESALTAAVREAEEEIGIVIPPSALKLIYTLHRKSDERTYIDLWFEAKRFDGVPVNKEPNKCAGLMWSNAQNLPENTQEYVKRALKDMQTNGYGSLGLT